MSAEHMAAFTEAAADPAVAQRISEAATVEQILAIASDLGYEVTADDLQQTRDELSDDDLQQASGGTYWTIPCPSMTSPCRPF